MNHYINTFLNTTKPYWKTAALIGVPLAVLIILVALISDSCGKPDVEKEKERIGNLQNQAANIQSNISNLEQQGAAKQGEVNIRRDDHNSAKNSTDGTRNATNAALANVDKVSNANYSNVNMTDAEKARCRAFPSRCQ